MLNYPDMYSLSERACERVAVNMQAIFTLAGFKIVPTIKNLICRCFFKIVRCDAVENYMFLRDSLLLLMVGWIVIWGGSQELHVFTVFLTGAR